MNRSRCPHCQAFVSVQSAINKLSDVCFCRSCGLTIHLSALLPSALVAGTRMAETRPLVAQCVATQNGFPASSKSNAHYSNFQPNGKIKKFSPSKILILPSPQLDLFGGAL